MTRGEEKLFTVFGFTDHNNESQWNVYVKAKAAAVEAVRDVLLEFRCNFDTIGEPLQSRSINLFVQAARDSLMRTSFSYLDTLPPPTSNLLARMR
jgi:hypothetical protein